MQFFIDSADIKEIKKLAEAGFVDGVTTNPSLVAEAGGSYKDLIIEIAKITPGPVSAEVLAVDYESMLKEAEIIVKYAPNIVIKLPLTLDGLRACKFLSNNKIKTNVTLCFSASQALLAAKAGASYISPFVGRLDDISINGMDLIKDIKTIYNNYNFSTEILVASVRSPMHVVEAAKIGADVVTIPPKIAWQLLKSPLTDSGLEKFLQDSNRSGQKIYS
jgi:transaldolase